MPNKLIVVVDMQYDFMMPDGALYVPGAEKLIGPMIQYLFDHSADDVIYTLDTHHAETYAQTEEAKLFPPHCLMGTKGRECVLPMRGSDRITKDVFDPWASSGNASYLAFMAGRYDQVEIIGVAADYCVRYTYEGFKARGFNVRVIPELTVGIKENPYA